MSADELAVREARSEEPRVTNAFWEQAGTIALAVLIALGIRSFVIEPFRIPSGSMFPTLLIGDHLFVNKFIFGVHVPFTQRRLPGLREPERGDVVVFTVARQGSQTFPADLRPELPREEFVKRIVGLPGDRIEIVEDVVYVNGEPLQATRQEEFFEDDRGQHLAVSRVSLPDRDFRVLHDPHRKSREKDTFTVAPDRYFMLGDNRDYSKDSRVWGSVRLAEIKGPAFMLYWSWTFNGGWMELLRPATWWGADVRWGRIGQSIE